MFVYPFDIFLDSFGLKIIRIVFPHIPTNDMHFDLLHFVQIFGFQMMGGETCRGKSSHELDDALSIIKLMKGDRPWGRIFDRIRLVQVFALWQFQFIKFVIWGKQIGACSDG